MTPWEKEFDNDDINAVNRWGETRLYKAAEDGDFELVKSLVERGADISIRTNENTSPRFIARKKKHAEIESFLFAIEQEHLESSKLLEEQALKALNASQAVKLEREKKEQEQGLKRKESEFLIWFYSYDLNETIGPVSFEELKQVYFELESDDMMVWSPNLDDWKKADEILDESNKERKIDVEVRYKSKQKMLGESESNVEQSLDENFENKKNGLSFLKIVIISILSIIMTKLFGLFGLVVFIGSYLLLQGKVNNVLAGFLSLISAVIASLILAMFLI